MSDLRTEKVLIPLPGGPEVVTFEWLPNSELTDGIRKSAWRHLAWETEYLWAVWKGTCPTCGKAITDAINQRAKWMNLLRDNRRRMVPTFKVTEHPF